jgi:hypothetical protein
MINTWILAALLAEAADGQSKPEVENHPINHPIMVQVPNGAMTCTKEGDHLVCVLPLHHEVADAPQLSAGPAPKARPYKRSPPTPALPDPQLLKQLKVAEENIELAKALLPRTTTPEGAVLAQQLLYWANQQYKWTQALMPAEQRVLPRAPDPFTGDSHESEDAQSM